MNSLTQLLKTEKDAEVIKNSYEFWKAEGKQHLFIDISIAHLNVDALKIILIAEGPGIFQQAYSLGSKASHLDIVSSLCKANKGHASVRTFLNREIMISNAWDRKKIVLWLVDLKKVNEKLPRSLVRYLVQQFI